jgi:3-oxoacid CoA-transferase subunit A
MTSDHGPPPGPVPGSVPGPVPGSLAGSVPGSLPGPVLGSLAGSVPGSLPGPVPGSLPGSVPGPVPGSVPGSLPGPVPVPGPPPGALPSPGGRLRLDKTLDNAASVLAAVRPGSTLAVGGFGLCGTPMALIEALHATGVDDLHVVSNNCGVDDWGLGILLRDRRISRVTASYVGENKEFARQYLAGELEVELIPQGTLAEKLRAGGCGIPAFFTPAGVGTPLADGGLPWRHRTPQEAGEGAVAVASPPKEVRAFGGRDHVLEEAVTADVALVHAWRGDRHGNLVYASSAHNFNPLCAMAGAVTIAQVEELVEPGELDPAQIHTPGIFVDHVVPLHPPTAKRIERRTVRPRPGSTPA